LALAAALVLIATGAGAIVAALVTGGHHSASRFVTRNVTQRQTVTAPAPPPPPRPPPPPAPTGLGGHELNDRGYSYIGQHNWAAAIPLLQQAVRQLAGTGSSDPYEAYANYNLGYALYRSGRCAEAVPYLRRADRLEPDRSEPRAYLKLARRCS
jgi:tetratricopeptide (TPR) repeat protein